MYSLATMLQFALLAVLIFVTIASTLAVVKNDGFRGIFKPARPRYRRTANK